MTRRARFRVPTPPRASARRFVGRLAAMGLVLGGCVETAPTGDETPGGAEPASAPDFLPDGRLLLYDNRGHKGPGGGSRIMEIDPATQKTEWVYAGNEQHPFYSRTRGKQQRLPNGNTLITESNGGRVFEVTRDREIVWEYVNALPATAGERRVGMVQDAARFGREELTFLTDRQKPSGSGAEAP